MDKKSLRITTGAMSTAIFGMLLLLNRQTGNLFQDLFVFLYPVPMVAYTAMYGWKSGLPVLAAMSLLSFLFGGFTTIFYAVTQALIGLIFGGCLYHKVDMAKTLFVVMALSAVVNVLNTVVLGFLFGIDINQEIAEMQEMMNTVFAQAGVTMPAGFLSENYLRKMIVVSMTLFGILQGWVVYELSLQILRRLRFPVQRPKSFGSFVPPKWTGYVALILFFVGSIPMPDENLQNTVFIAASLGYMYLVWFGCVALFRVWKRRFPNRKLIGGILCFLGMMMFPFAMMVSGFLYLTGRYFRDPEEA